MEHQHRSRLVLQQPPPHGELVGVCGRHGHVEVLAEAVQGEVGREPLEGLGVDVSLYSQVRPTCAGSSGNYSPRGKEPVVRKTLDGLLGGGPNSATRFELTPDDPPESHTDLSFLW